jgi:hypothetical protein
MPNTSIVSTGDVLTATNFNYLPRGLITSATNTGANQASITSTTDLTSMTTTATYTSGRLYLVMAETHFISTVAGDYALLALNVGGSTLYSTYYGYVNAAEVQTMHLMYLTSSLSGSTTIKLQMGRSTGTGTLTAYHTRRSQLQVYDMGVA